MAPVAEPSSVGTPVTATTQAPHDEATAATVAAVPASPLGIVRSAVDGVDADRIAELRALGNTEARSKNWQRASELYSEAIALLPSGADHSDLEAHALFGNRCLCKTKLGRFADAKIDAQESVARNPSYAKGFFRLALCQIELADLAGAWESSSRAANLDPGDEQIQALVNRVEKLETGG
eukprot:TRINITY_DN51206_c0_g1_i1.p1 TRINITY_DN51206_c0_g1~~TRINITY_DN51206_c0_g1_i1.p1  ORF type:complete len:180 (-),score=32.05 TRINITY_DN51206_c0_g1_i1:30-569(-)